MDFCLGPAVSTLRASALAFLSSFYDIPIPCDKKCSSSCNSSDFFYCCHIGGDVSAGGCCRVMLDGCCCLDEKK